MAFSKGGAKKRSGLDDGMVKTKKQKKQEAAENLEKDEANNKSEEQTQSKDVLKIQPGESMQEFRARVDAALPLSGITRTARRLQVSAITGLPSTSGISSVYRRDGGKKKPEYGKRSRRLGNWLKRSKTSWMLCGRIRQLT